MNKLENVLDESLLHTASGDRKALRLLLKKVIPDRFHYPTCHAFAEDVVCGLADKSNCIFVMKEEIKQVTDTLSHMAHMNPPLQNKGKT